MIHDFEQTIDRGLTYAILAEDADAHRGQAVRFRGRVINLAPPSRGRTQMQILLSDGCPSEMNCLLHVVFNGTTSATVNTQVTIYGTVLGRWEGRNERGETLTAPSLQARFLVLSPTRRR